MTGIALIGSGIFAKEEHLPAIQAASSLNLVAVYSRSLKSAQTLSEQVSSVDLYSNDQEGKGYDDLLKRDDIKGVIIALPILAQPKYIKKALAAGKHVLAEKPVAKDIATAQELISWAQDSSNTQARLAIAENFRFLESFQYAAAQIAQFGRILTFRVRICNFAAPGNKYYETEWRKTPEYQGGFLLDGGVHFAAGIRLLLEGGNAAPAIISAFTAQLQEHLPPVDTMHSTIQLNNGSSGTFTISFGTTDRGNEYFVASEKGTVHVSRGKVVVTRGDQEEVKEFPSEGSGVKQEVRAWADSLESGEANPAQSAVEAFKDLVLIECALKSGEMHGQPCPMSGLI